MFTIDSADPLATQFRPYLRLHTQTMEHTLRRMRLPIPAGMMALPGGIRACLLGDTQLRGTITSKVIEAFSESVAAEAVSPGGAEGWIVTVTRRITRTCAKQHARQLARLGTLHHEDGSFLDHLVPSNETPEVMLAAAQETVQVRALLGALSLQDQELVQAYFIDERSYEELALAYGCPLPTLRKRVERLCTRLRKIGDDHEMKLCA